VNYTCLKFVVILFILLVSTFSTAFAKYDPDLKWHTIETNHFLFHYHDGLEEQARELIAKSDAIRIEVSAYFNWVPKDKTHVIFNDHLDITNASATPFPNNTIEIYMSPPAEIASLEDYGDWVELVFKHEYVHIVHLDKAHDFPYHARKFFGRFPLFFPNIFSPRWITEGLATFLETDHENGFGRGQSNYFRGLMRNELINGFKPLNVVNQNILDWPAGTTAYLYGVYFFNFLRAEYGDEIIKDYVDRYSHFPLPFFINTITKRATGKSMHTLWVEFEFYLYQEFSDEMSNSRFMEPKNHAITDTGYFSGFSKTLENGNILLIKSDLEQLKTLEEYNPKTEESRVISTLLGQEPIFGQTFDYHVDRGVLMPVIDYLKSTHLNFDLFRIDITTGERYQLTNGQRFIRAIWSPDGNNIIAIKNQSGKHSMELLDDSGTFIKTLWSADNNYVFSSLDWEPNGKQIIASVRKDNETLNLALFDLDSEQWTAVTRNNWFEAHPSFSQDGSKLYYTADYDGIYNIYELNLNNRDLYKLTNTPTVALYPNIDEENSALYFAELGKNGFDTTAQQADLFYQYKDHVLLESFFSTPESDNTSFKSLLSDSQSTDTTDNTALEAKPYSGISYLAPPVWFPIFIIDDYQRSFGILTWSNDPLARHIYNALLEFDFKNNEMIWDVTYAYTYFKPDLVITSRNANFYPNSLLYRNEKEYSFTISYSHLKSANQWFYYLSYKKLFIEINEVADHENTILTASDEIFSTGIARNSAQKPGIAVNAHSGNFLSLAYENNKVKESEFELQSRVIAKAIYYSPLVYHSVFEADITIIAAGSQAGDLYLGGRQRESATQLVSGKRTYSLKGYAPDQFIGTNLQKLEVITHIPIAKPQRGIMSPPLGLMRIDAHPFAQAGRVGSFSTVNNASWSTSVGLEITADLNFGYGGWPFLLSTGIAEGLNTHGETHYWIEVSAEF